MAYTPGLKVAAATLCRRRRVLPIPGKVLKQVGDRVEAHEIVAQTFMPGDVIPLNLANLLSVSAGDVPGCLLKKEGERIAVGEPLARSKGLFGLFQRDYNSTVAGTIESVSTVTGQVMMRGEPIPVQVQAYLAGKVVEVIPDYGVDVEAPATVIQGIFGIGGEAFGPIRRVCASPDEPLRPDLIRPELRGAIVVGGARASFEAIQKAIHTGCAALVSGGIDDQDLKTLLGYDLGVAVTGSEHIGLTLIITEGFGEIAMAKRTFELFGQREGELAAVNGATQIRAGVIRPEIVVPLPAGTSIPSASDTQAGLLALGTPVRIIRDPHFGLLGTIKSLPPEPRVLESESKARVLEVSVSEGSVVVVPRANVELIEE